jgi:hypothetical protein
MADTPKGYGSPKVESVRVIRLAADESSLLEGPQVGRAPLLRFEVRGEEEFPLRSMPLMIQVGGRGYLATEIAGDGRTIACALDEIPEEGAVIRVGYPPNDFTELPERFSRSMLETAEPGPGDGV